MAAKLVGEGNEARQVCRVLYLGTPLLTTPNRKSAKVAYLQDGATLEVLDNKKGFVRVRTELGGLGWVARDSVSD